MTIKDDILFDFAVNMPRVLVSGRTAVLDNVRKLMLLTDSEIVVFNGQRYTSVTGEDFVVTELKEERMLVSGEVKEIRFFKTLQEDQG
ncbi:MAG: YabP/YqfC family sporulation protein [Firmicutes bacterium]|nr:YabP/YqfC family sporulation protein [Bacillota bacterium]